MPITITKDAAAGSGGDTTLTIRNIDNLMIKNDIIAAQIPDLIGDAETALILADLAPLQKIDIAWTITEENSTVVSGSGSPVTTAAEQVAYLSTVLAPTGDSQITDVYTLVILFDETPLTTGTASSGTSTTLVDTGIGWTADAFVMNLLHMTGGTGSGQYRTILDNTTDTITVSRAFDTNPDGTTQYEILNAIGKVGRLGSVTATLSGMEPLTFKGSFEFLVGKVS